jgi:FMN-dependent NADH-azoreductase
MYTEKERAAVAPRLQMLVGAIAGGTLAADIPAEHREQLARLGLIMDVLGVTRLTSIGMERLRATSHHHQLDFISHFVLFQT